jgi:nucleoid DNA-binding protein
MNIKELVEAARSSSDKVADIPEAKARALVKTVFGEVLKQIEQGGAEPVRIWGLGVFKTREVQKPGEASARKVIIFRKAAPKHD